jgi:hypothetical protein
MNMFRLKRCIDQSTASAWTQWQKRARVGRAQPGGGALSFAVQHVQGQKRAHRRGGGVLVGVQPPLQRLVGGLQPDLVHVKGRRPAGMRGTAPVSLQPGRHRLSGVCCRLSTAWEQILRLCPDIIERTYRSRSRKRSAVGTAGWMTLHWLQKKKDTRGTCGLQPCLFRTQLHISDTCVMLLTCGRALLQYVLYMKRCMINPTHRRTAAPAHSGV